MSSAASSSRSNPLYAVDGGVADAIDELKGLTIRRLSRLVDAFVKDPVIKPSVLVFLDELYAALSKTKDDDRLAGAVGFCLLVRQLDAGAHGVRLSRAARALPASHAAGTEPSVAASPTELLRTPAVIQWLLDWYGCTDNGLDFSESDYPVLGTTSFIVRCKDVEANNLRALKCLLPRYVDSPQITDKTEKYKDLWKGVPGTPTIHQSRPRFILMDWVSAPTLAQSWILARHDDQVHDITEPAAPTPDFIQTSDEFDDLKKFALALCNRLADYHDLRDERHPNGVHHLDISPNNVFAEPDASKTGLGLTFIDFGVNFLASERTGTTRAVSEAALYMAPEIADASIALDDNGEPTDPHAAIRADLYSVGILFLQILARNQLRTENRDPLLRDLWEYAPGWARIIEELIAETSDDRLSLMPPRYTNPYRYLHALVEQEAAVIDVFGVRANESNETNDPAGAVPQFRPLRVRSYDEPRRMRTAASKLTLDDSYPQSLSLWASISIGWWVTNLILFVSFTFADLGTSNPVSDVVRPLVGSHLPYDIGPAPGHHWRNFGHNLPGRLVAFTFGMCAAGYYMNIFATLSLLRLKRWRFRAGDFFARACAWFPGIPVAVTIAWNPHLWPYMSFAGAVAVIINNALMLRVFRAASTTETQEAALSGRKQARTPVMRLRNISFDKEFKEWWRLMALYAAFLLGTGLLITFGVIRNTWFYAAVVAVGVNYLKLYRLNSIGRQITPRVRGNLQRAIYVLRRQQALEARVDVLSRIATLTRANSLLFLTDGKGSSVRLPAPLVARLADDASAGLDLNANQNSVPEIAAESGVRPTG